MTDQLEQQPGRALAGLHLYELAPAFAAAMRDLEEIADPADETAFADIGARLEAIQTTIESKGAAIASIIREYELGGDALQDEIDRLSIRKQVLTARAARLRRYLYECIKRAGLDRVDARLFTLTIRQNPERVDVLDESQVPDRFKSEVVTIKIDKNAIKAEAKKTGTIPPGVQIARGDRLEIR